MAHDVSFSLETTVDVWQFSLPAFCENTIPFITKWLTHLEEIWFKRDLPAIQQLHTEDQLQVDALLYHALQQLAQATPLPMQFLTDNIIQKSSHTPLSLRDYAEAFIMDQLATLLQYNYQAPFGYMKTAHYMYAWGDTSYRPKNAWFAHYDKGASVTFIPRQPVNGIKHVTVCYHTVLEALIQAKQHLYLKKPCSFALATTTHVAKI